MRQRPTRSDRVVANPGDQRIQYSPSRHAKNAARQRALAHAQSMKRAILGAKDGTSALGLGASIRAIQSGSVGELLVTRRFAERHPAASANLTFLAAVFGVLVSRVTGQAELQLDLAAGGVASLARRTNGTHH